MNVLNLNDRSCERYWPYFDAYLDHELPVETQQDIRQHVVSCKDCARILESRGRMKQLVRNAVTREEAPLELVEALRGRFQKESRSFFAHNTAGWMMAAAAVLILAIGGVAVLRWDRVVQPSNGGGIFQTVSTRVKELLRVGLADHLHWPEYLIEGSCLGLFMISACSFGVLLFHPNSPAFRLIRNPILLRVLMGLAMGTTAIALIYSRFGKRSGAHMNPAVTLTFLRLGKIALVDGLFYAAAQFAGAIIGVGIASIVLGGWLSHPAVDYVVTLPGVYGRWWAFAGEAAITFVLMSVILRVSNTPRLNRYTGVFAALLVMTYISIEAPISGMSMNPARTLGSAFSAANWAAIWIYFTAPPLGMLLAAEFYVRTYGAARVLCAKLHHDNLEGCIFHCNYPS